MIIYSTIEKDVVKKLLFQRGYILFAQCEVHGQLREKKAAAFVEQMHFWLLISCLFIVGKNVFLYTKTHTAGNS